MKQINIHDAEPQLARLLEDVERGERIAARRRRLGLFAGDATMHDDFDQLPDDIAAAFSAQ